MRRELRQWRTLPRRERRVLVLLAVLQPVISLALGVRGYRWTHAWLERHSRPGNPRNGTEEELADARRAAELAAMAGGRGPVATTCLRQALAVYWLLRRRGLQPQVTFGVDRIGATPDMHAWVELEGVPLAQPHLRHAAFQPATSASTASTTSSSTS